MADTITKQGAGDGKRAQAKAANRQEILEAARRVFARLGVESATVRDIIRETSLAAGTFYNYFKSKEEVFQALADESTIRFRPRLADVRAQSFDFETYIRTAYRAYFEFLRDENEPAIESGAPHMTLIGVRIDTPEMATVVEEIRADLEKFLSGEVSEALDTEYITAAAVGIARELGDYMLKRRPLDVDGATEFAANLFLTGMASFGMPRKT
ncbi:MAG: TetR/AcrR family transcriptional regulator [Pseudomonadota bacterium]